MAGGGDVMQLSARIGAAALVALAAIPTNTQAAPKARGAARAPSDSAYIFNSGGGTLPGYRVYVGANGHLSSVILLRSGRTTGGRRGTLTPTVARRFFADLAAAGPVGSLPSQPLGVGNAPTDAPTVRVFVRYHGQQSPDLRRSASGAGAKVYQDAKQIVQVLRLPVPDNP